MIQPIVHDPLFLAQKSARATPADADTASDSWCALTAHADGCVGMAANMIGGRKRIIAFFDHGALVVMINPVLLRRSPETYEAEEGCLSLQGTRKTTRARWVELSWTPLRGKKQRGRFSGFTAEVIQHEMDHLEGILI